MRYFLVLLLTAAMPILAQGAATVDLATVANGPVMLNKGNMDYYRSELALGWESIGDVAEEDWAAPPSDTVSTWAPEQAQWLRIKLRNGGDQVRDFRLEVRWPQMDSMQMAVMRDGRLEGIRQAGNEHYDGEPRLLDRSLIFPIHLQARQEATVYLRIVDDAFLYLPMLLWTEEHYYRHADTRLVVLSAVVGILLVMVLYNGSLFLFTRDGMYLAYSNSVISTLLFVLAITGLGRLLWGDSAWFRSHAYPVFSSYAFLSVTYFFRVFVGLKHYRGWVLRLNTVFIAMWLILLVFNLLGLEQLGMGLTAPGGVLGTAAGIITAIYLALKGSRPAKYFAVAWAPVSFASTYSIFAIMGMAPHFAGMEYLFPLGFAVEVVVLSIALADRINSERQAREAAQALAFERQQSILRIQEQANTELEAQVDSRTRELQRALEALARANGELSELSRTDPLTGLSNRRHFDELAEAEVARAARSGQSVSMMIVDIDHFKDINDLHGHLVGDDCLKLVAQAIRQVASRETDTVARYGGEEFAIILPATGEREALQLAEGIRRAIAEVRLLHDGQNITTTASVGVASTTLDRPCAVESVVSAADKALYRAKQNGRNQVQVAQLASVTSLEASK